MGSTWKCKKEDHVEYNPNIVYVKSITAANDKSIIKLNNIEVNIDGADESSSAVLIVVADPKTRIVLETKSFPINPESCDT